MILSTKIAYSYYFLLVLFTFLLVSGCYSDQSKAIPDISDIEVDLVIKRFEQDLFNIDTLNTEKGIQQLQEKYPLFYKNIFVRNIIPALQLPGVTELFIKTPELRQLYDTTQLVYGNFDKIEKELTQAFKYYKYYFPQQKVPQIITYISEYTLGNFVAEDQLGIGLDFYLGADYPKYNRTFFPHYITRSMNKEHLVSKTMKAVADDLVGEVNGARLLDYMINNGKKLYLLDLFLPYEPDSVKLEFTATQTEWLKENELPIWSHLVGEDLLYSSQYNDIKKLIDYSPNAPGMPPEAPGRTANWIGKRIIASLMERNPDISPQDLIQMKDAQKILHLSKYKPR